MSREGEEESTLQLGGQHGPKTIYVLVRNNGIGQRDCAGKWGREHLVEVKRGRVTVPWRPGQPI